MSRMKVPLRELVSQWDNKVVIQIQECNESNSMQVILVLYNWFNGYISSLKCFTLGFVDMNFCNRAELKHRLLQGMYA